MANSGLLTRPPLQADISDPPFQPHTAVISAKRDIILSPANSNVPEAVPDADRWRAAQSYEQGWWSSMATQISSGSTSQLSWYKWRADQLKTWLETLGLNELTAGNARVLEVGSGPVGLVSYFPGRERIALDPLQGFYASDPVLSALRDQHVDYRTGVGEKIPCDSNSIDLLVIDNCIDHVQNVTGVMDELFRVVRPGGILYLSVNSRIKVGYYMHRMLSRLRIDRGHPHTFTPPRAARLIQKHGFEIVDTRVTSALKAFVDDIRGPGARSRLKALLAVTEFPLFYIARKPSSTR